MAVGSSASLQGFLQFKEVGFICAFTDAVILSVS